MTNHFDGIMGKLGVMNEELQSIRTETRSTATTDQLHGLINYVGTTLANLPLPTMPAAPFVAPPAPPLLPPPASESISEAPSQPARYYQIQLSHPTVLSLYQEWYGLGPFNHSNNPICFPGGIAALENDPVLKKVWRKDLKNSVQTIFSRHVYLVRAIDQRIREGATREVAIAYFEGRKGNKAITTLVSKLKSDQSAGRE